MVWWSELSLLGIKLSFEDYAYKLPCWVVEDLLLIKAVEAEYTKEQQGQREQ